MYGFSHAPELIILLVIALVIFGPNKLPDLGKRIGQGIREFRKATTGDSGDKDQGEAGKDAVTAASATTPPVAEGPQASTDTTAGSPAATPPKPNKLRKPVKPNTIGS